MTLTVRGPALLGLSLGLLAALCAPSPAFADDEDTKEACRDGKDNDHDGKTDCDDDECRDFAFCAERKPEDTARLCKDGIDNDLDGKADCADPDCAEFVFCLKVSKDAQNLTPAAPPPPPLPAWDIDPAHASAGFSVRHLMISSVTGRLGKVTGTVILDEKDFTRSSVEATVDVAGIDTGDARRDAHLRSADFLDVQNHPTLTFRSKKLSRPAKGRFKVTGDLTLRGVTREVTLEVEGPSKAVADVSGHATVAFAATGKINRGDFGLKWNKPLDRRGVLVGEEVTLRIEAEAKKRAAQAPAAE